MSRIRSRARSGTIVDEPEQVLVRVPEAHAPADAGLEHRRRARQVERHHALVGVPGVDHPVDVRVAGRHLERRRAAPPRSPAGPRGRRRPVPAAGSGRCTARARDVSGRREPGGSNLPSAGFSRVAEDERHVARLAGLQHQRRLERPDRLPAVGDRAGHRAALDRERPVPAPVRPEERLARRVEPGHGRRAREPGEVVAALAVLGHVVDDAVLDVDLAGGQVALEVRGVVLGVPQAELDGAEQRQARARRPLVGDPRPPHLERLAGRHEVQRLGADAAAPGRDDRVARARGGRSTRRARAASAASPGSSSRPCRRRGRTGTGRRRRAGRCCSGTGSAAAAARHGRTSSRRRCSRAARSSPRCPGS